MFLSSRKSLKYEVGVGEKETIDDGVKLFFKDADQRKSFFDLEKLKARDKEKEELK